MGTEVFASGPVVQVGIVVRDIERTSAEFARIFGIEKPSFSWTDGYEKSRAEYRGRPSNARAKLAFMKFGNLDIELIEPDREQSTWREFLETRGEGIHHLAFIVEGMKARIELAGKAGIPLAQKGEYAGGRYAYLEASESLKFIVELLENDRKLEDA